jgi:hypothetical protein
MGRVDAFSSVSYRISFAGGELAEVIVNGDDDTDLDLYVFDRLGNLVAVDDDETDLCIGRWVPERTQVYRIVIRNIGPVYNDYMMSTN